MILPAKPSLPILIQGGMGIGVSDWRLARAVARRGHLGVISGTCIDSLLVRRLQDGDPGGHMRRGIRAFPRPDVGERVLERYYQPDGRPSGTPYALLPMWTHGAPDDRVELAVLAAFVEVYLARVGHNGFVGMNLLTKLQLPNLATLYGAMLAGVDCVLMGAGIPREIPGALDRLARHEPATMRLEVEGPRTDEPEEVLFDPRTFWSGPLPPALLRPDFLPIVASNSLARMMARKANGPVDGFVVEGPTAGGHNAPPRGAERVDERGRPVYGARDEVDLDELAELDLPFWLAGGEGTPEALARALEQGAAGIQVGTLFAYTDESGLAPGLKRTILGGIAGGSVGIHTDLRASPTGFPFKVVELDGTASDDEVHRKRKRVCDLGYLRTPYRRPDGRVGYRCPAEPVETFVKKGGRREDTVGRRCLCNALMADVGHPQLRKDGPEPALVTSGDDLVRMGPFLAGRTSYSVDDVIDYLTGPPGG